MSAPIPIPKSQQCGFTWIAPYQTQNGVRHMTVSCALNKGHLEKTHRSSYGVIKREM